MTTTATAFAQTTRISKNALDMKKRVLSLYRSFIRNVRSLKLHYATNSSIHSSITFINTFFFLFFFLTYLFRLLILLRLTICHIPRL